MCYWITDKSPTIQDDVPNKVLTLNNQLLMDKGNIYLVPRNTSTDNYTIPLGINKSKWDVRPAHLHDIGCYYHQVIKVRLPLEIIYNDYCYLIDNRIICRDIPKENLEVVDISFKECNDLLLKGMVGINNIPKLIDKIYRLAVNLNLGWLFTGKSKIDLDLIYNNKLYTYNR